MPDPFEQVKSANESSRPLSDFEGNDDPDFDKYHDVQREARLVAEVHKYKYGSYTGQTGGTEYFFVCEYEVSEVLSQSDHKHRYKNKGLEVPEGYEAGGTPGRPIREGGLRQFFQKMPNPAVPFSDLGVGEQADWNRIFQCAGAAARVPAKYMQADTMQQIAVSESSEPTDSTEEYCKKIGSGGGALIGIEYRTDIPGSDTSYANQTFTKASFFPVDEDGEEVDWMSKEELVEEYG